MARLACPYLLTVATLALVAVPQAGANAGYDEAVSALRAGEFEAAAGMFEDLLRDSPDWAAGHVALAQCRFLLGDPARAEEHLAQARRIDPGTDPFRTYLGAGELLLARRRWAEAAVPLERALALATEERRSTVAQRLAQSWLLGGDAARALGLLEDLASTGEGDGRTWWLLAEARRASGDYDAALEALRAALAREMDDDTAGRVREELAQWSYYRALMPANASRREDMLAQALEDARPWIEHDPASARAQAAFADAAIAAGRPDEIMRQLDAGSCSARVHLARACNSLSDRVAAEQHARAAVGCDPSDPAARVELATALVLGLGASYSAIDEVIQDRDVVDAALEELREAVRLDRDETTRAGTLLAQVEITRARLAETETEFRKQDEEHRDEIVKTAADVLLQRCRVVHWLLRDESRMPSDEDRAFYRDNDCARRIRDATPTDARTR